MDFYKMTFKDFRKMYDENKELKEERVSMISDYSKKIDMVNYYRDENKELKKELDSLIQEHQTLSKDYDELYLAMWESE